MRKCFLMLVTFWSGLVLSTAAFAADPFPRVAVVSFGAPFNYGDAAFQQSAARANLVLLNYWPGMAPGGSSMDSVVRNIKKINPATKVFLYAIGSELADEGGNSSNDAWAEKRKKVNDMKWWLYEPSGSRVLAAFAVKNGKSIYVTNITRATQKDVSGYQYWDWNGRWVVNKYFGSTPSIDGLFEDNVFWKPRVAGDWNRDGTIDSAGDAKAAQDLRQGYQQYFGLLRKLMPGKYQLGNVADWGAATAVFPEYQGMLDGGLMEKFLGVSGSPETWGGWQEMMRWYRKTLAAVGGPKLLIFQQGGAPTEYQSVRYGIASCLMDDAYYSFYDPSKGYTGAIWFDELGVKLGQATSEPATTPWQKGVYRRDFENGIALVNPKDNGSVTVTLEADFKRIAGKQDTSVNNGKVGRTVTLKDRDGILLLRVGAQQQMVKPAPPTGVVAQ